MERQLQIKRVIGGSGMPPYGRERLTAAGQAALLWAASAIAVLVWSATACRAAEPRIYTLDARHPQKEILAGHLKMGAASAPNGDSITVNNFYLARNGKPWLPVMGELHFSRYPRHMWEDAVLKMKAAGVDVVATYVFWNHHEEVAGEFDWSGGRDLRAFVQLCARHGLLVYPRIGPWCHGEVRNGGFPDWVQSMPGKRTDDAVYLESVRRLYAQIFRQCAGLLFKDGGPIIGIQLENEYSGPTEHIVTLKRIAQEVGFDVPLYTATGWGVDIPEDEVLPVHGGYADAPWERGSERLAPNGQYLFCLGLPLDGTGIGSDVLPRAAEEFGERYNKWRYPWLMAELGLGNQIKYNRRPIVTDRDAYSLLVTKLGGGANLIGYYIYHGGTNPIGKLSTLEEPGYPQLSYDFQCAVSEFGETNDKYRQTKLIHYWLQDFGSELATMSPVLPNEQPVGVEDTATLRFMARVNERGSGYLFLSNYQRYVESADVGPQQIAVQLPGEELLIPSSPFVMPKGAAIVWPMNLDVGDARLKWATAQLVCRLSAADGDTYFFFAPAEIEPEYAFRSESLRSIDVAVGRTRVVDGQTFVDDLTPAISCSFKLVSATGKRVTICTLSRDVAMQFYRFSNLWGRPHVVLSDGDALSGDDELEVRRIGSPPEAVWLDPAPEALTADGTPLAGHAEGVFARFALPSVRPSPELNVTLREVQGRPTQWEIDVPADALEDATDVYLDVDYVGDVARIWAGDTLLADHYYYGPPWRPSLRHWGDRAVGKTLRLEIDPFTSKTQCYLEPEPRLRVSSGDGPIAEVVSFRAERQFRVILTSGASTEND